MMRAALASILIVTALPAGARAHQQFRQDAFETILNQRSTAAAGSWAVTDSSGLSCRERY
jgi:hypothetical protein